MRTIVWILIPLRVSTLPLHYPARMSGLPSDEGPVSAFENHWVSHKISEETGIDTSVPMVTSGLTFQSTSDSSSSYPMYFKASESKEDTDLSKISFELRVESSDQASRLEPTFSESLVIILVSTFLDSLKNLVNFTNHVNIVIRQVESSPSVAVVWGLSSHKNFSSSDTSGSSHLVNLPGDVISEGARHRQLFVLGNILLKIYEPKTGKIKGLELYKELEEGIVSEKVQLAAHWPLICSCLSYKFAKSAFVQAPRIYPGSALRGVAVTGTVIAVACLGTPLVLGAAGWSASGVVAGSLAAGWQSSIGAVASGSLFATLQSFAATGFAGLTAAGGVSGAVAAATAGASQFVPNFNSTPYQYLYDSDLNDKSQLEKLLYCKKVDVLLKND